MVHSSVLAWGNGVEIDDASYLMFAISCMFGRHGKRRRTDTITTKIGKEMTLPMLQSGNHPSTCQKKPHAFGLRLRM